MKLSPLAPGGTIGVMAPSSYVEAKDIEKSKALLEKRGYKVFIHPQTYERHNQSAGTHLQKTLALQGLWQRDDIDVIWAAGGGNRAMHLLDSINFNAMKRKPKLFIGFSDVTALLNAITVHTGFPSIHGPVFKNIHTYEHLDHMLDLLSGKKNFIPLGKNRNYKKRQSRREIIRRQSQRFSISATNITGRILQRRNSVSRRLQRGTQPHRPHAFALEKARCF